MEKIHVVYWSETGNTKSMAQAIGKGIEEAKATLEKPLQKYK